MTRPTDLVKLNDARERVIAQLSEAFAQDRIAMDDFESRLTLAHRADSVVEVERVVSDLAVEAPSTALAAVPVATPAVTSEQDGITAVFGGVERRGPWVLPRRLEVRAFFGGIVLDLREAILPPGRTEIHVAAVMGGVQVIVPPSLPVEVSGTAILGGFAHLDRVPAQLDASRPSLRVSGLAMMGGVAVETRLSGESETDAHRRRKGGAALAR